MKHFLKKIAHHAKRLLGNTIAEDPQKVAKEVGDHVEKVGKHTKKGKKKVIGIVKKAPKKKKKTK